MENIFVAVFAMTGYVLLAIILGAMIFGGICIAIEQLTLLMRRFKKKECSHETH